MCIWFCILFLWQKKRWDFKKCHSLQPSSSAPFRQSLPPSHLHLIGTHVLRLSPQLNCSGLQGLSEIKTKTNWESVYLSIYHTDFFVIYICVWVCVCVYIYIYIYIYTVVLKSLHTLGQLVIYVPLFKENMSDQAKHIYFTSYWIHI